MDETGGQIAVFGRIGSRPFNLEEMKQFYLNDEGKPWTVSDQVDPARMLVDERVPVPAADLDKTAPTVTPHAGEPAAPEGAGQ